MIESLALSNALYKLCYVLGFVIMFIFNTYYGKNYKIPKLKAFIFSLISYIIIFAWSYVLAWVANGFKWGHHNAIRVFIWMPVVLYFTGKIFKIGFKVCCDYITPSTCIVYGIARLGCIFAGCCYGYKADWGMYSRSAGYRCIPVQLFEAITSLAIAMIMILLAKKRKYDPTKANLYPIMMILFGSTRFLWEFAADNKKVIFNISELAIWALITFIVGLFWLWSKTRTQKSQKI